MRQHPFFALLALLAASLTATLLVGCKPELPSGVLSESKMERVLYDFHLAQGMAEMAPREEGQTVEQLQYEYFQSMLRKHGITEAQFDTSMVYYCSDLDRMNRVYKKVEQRLQRETEALGLVLGEKSVFHSLSSDGDTANVWADRPLFVVTPKLTDNLQTWQMTCDSTWLEGDDLIWRFSLSALTRGGFTDCFTDIVVTYTNDSVKTYLTNANTQKDYELRVSNPKDWIPRQITGHLYCNLSTDPQMMNYIFISKIALIRLHKPQSVRDSWHQQVAEADTTGTDTLQVDSIQADSLGEDTPERRRSPQEFREEQVVDRHINVVKQKPYQPVKNGRRRLRPALNGKKR